MNIIIIFADQMHKYAISKLNSFISTPNIDRLCKDGVMFTNAYSNNPVCTPFRGVLFSGQFSSKCGVINNDDPLPGNMPMMADIFNNAGYETGFTGKWHLGDKGNKAVPQELRGGFKHFFGYQCYNEYYQDVCFYDEDESEHRFEQHRETICTNIAIEQIKQMHNTGKPFLQVTGYQAPHYPEQPSPEFEALYADKEIPVPPDFIDTNPYTPTFSPFSPRPYELCPNFLKYGNDMQEYLRLYYGMVSQVDHGVGRILDLVTELNIQDETMIIFTSDHGDMQGSHGLKNKCLPYERSSGIPFIVSLPNGNKDKICEMPVSAVDIFPTIIDCAGIDQLEKRDGNTLKSILIGDKEYNHPPVYAENFNNSLKVEYDENPVSWVMVREGKHKLVVDVNNKKPCLLFDIDKDPFEQKNLIDDNEDIVNLLYETVKNIGGIINPEE